MKNNFRTLIIIGVLVITAACAGNSPTPNEDADLGGVSNYSVEFEAAAADESAGYARLRSEETESLEESLPEDRMIIRNAWLNVSADDVNALFRDISAHARELGGYVFSYSIENNDDFIFINTEIKVPPDKLMDFLDYTGDRGEITRSSMSSEDVTDSYYDAATRLETKRKSLERYYDLLGDARNVDEIIQIQRTIDIITEDIEALEGRIKVLNSQVGMATVDLSLYQTDDPARHEIEWNAIGFSDMGYLIKRSFVTGANIIVSILQWLIIIVIGLSPLWIVVILGILLFRFIKRKLNQKKIKKLDDKNKAE